jgi:hypothetical protein
LHYCCARTLSNTLAVLSLAFQCPGEPFLLGLVVHIAHGIPILMLHLGQAAVHLPTSPHTKVWMAIVEATRPEDRGAIWGRLCNVLPCSCLNTLWKFETCRRGIRQPWNLQAHTYHASIVSGLKGFIYHSSTSQTCHELMDIYVFLIYACLHGACMYVYFPCVHLPV